MQFNELDQLNQKIKECFKNEEAAELLLELSKVAKQLAFNLNTNHEKIVKTKYPNAYIRRDDHRGYYFLWEDGSFDARYIELSKISREHLWGIVAKEIINENNRIS